MDLTTASNPKDVEGTDTKPKEVARKPATKPTKKRPAAAPLDREEYVSRLFAGVQKKFPNPNTLVALMTSAKTLVTSTSREEARARREAARKNLPERLVAYQKLLEGSDFGEEAKGYEGEWLSTYQTSEQTDIDVVLKRIEEGKYEEACDADVVAFVMYKKYGVRPAGVCSEKKGGKRAESRKFVQSTIKLTGCTGPSFPTLKNVKL